MFVAGFVVSIIMSVHPFPYLDAQMVPVEYDMIHEMSHRQSTGLNGRHYFL